MPSVQDVLAAKGHSVFYTTPQTNVLDAVHKMNEHKLGALVVMEDGRACGMFTERDVLKRVVGDGLSPVNTIVADVMTRDVICVEPSAELDEVSAIMKQRRIRHVPVCEENGQVVGMISIGDVNGFYASNQEATLTFLNDYIYGRG